MATVYLARDIKHHRQVALKVLHPDLAHALGVERFLREIEIAAGLQHPHILTVHDSGVASSLLWYTMPFVEGESLRDRLTREKQLPVEDALRLTREAADALDYAHRHGVVHRDIKPENILLSESHALVADFGIGKAEGKDESHLTATGLVMGTAAYMSPEQAAGDKSVGPRSDIYSLATVCYELLAGPTPFEAPTAQAMLARRLTESPRPIREVRDEVPPAIELALSRALASDPEQRFATAAEFGRALAPNATVPDWSSAGVAAIRARSRFRALFATPLLVVAIGLGLWFTLRGKGSAEGDDIIRLAVLPFENRGAAADAYFADGIADELRGKLARLAGLRITARTSSDQYRESSDSPRDIGRELGVTYLLNATVRWAKASDGSSRVQVVPELVRAQTGEIAWQQPFEADLTDIFQIQAQIASQVADALGAVLGAGEQRDLAEQPTGNLAAYDWYLQASAVTGSGQDSRRQKITLLEQALALDSAFARAWATLSIQLSGVYQNGASDPAVAKRSLDAAERAIRFNPGLPEAYQAMAEHHYSVTRDAERAEEQILRALKLSPNNASLLGSAAKIERQTGRFEEALTHLQQAGRLDPRSITTLNLLQTTLLWLRRYPEALAASESLLLRRPDDLGYTQDKAMAYLAQGDLASARALVAGLSRAHPDSTVGAFFSYYWDMYWVLDDAQQRRVLQLSPASFDDDRAAWATVLMQLYWLRGDSARARAYADTAYVENRALEQAAPDDAQRKVLTGLALAYLGRKPEAIANGTRGAALSPLSSDKINGPYYQHQLARIYLLLGEPEKALDQLEPLLKTPYYLSPGWLRLDPTFASLEGNPRYDRLLTGR